MAEAIAVPFKWIVKVQFGNAYITKANEEFSVVGVAPLRYIDDNHKWVAGKSKEKIFKSLVEAVRAINEAEDNKPLTLVREVGGNSSIG